jgi:hypothetical protein
MGVVIKRSMSHHLYYNIIMANELHSLLILWLHICVFLLTHKFSFKLCLFFLCFPEESSALIV